MQSKQCEAQRHPTNVCYVPTATVRIFCFTARIRLGIIKKLLDQVFDSFGSEGMIFGFVGCDQVDGGNDSVFAVGI